MTIPKAILINYILYFCGFIFLLILPSGWYRLLYLHIISLIAGSIANDQLKFYVLFGMFHSAIHNIWPFLTEDGYNNLETSTYDVFCHMMMMIVCYNLIKNNIKKNKIIFHLLTYTFLLGSFLNCIVSYLIIGNNDEFVHFVFEYSTIFQAISTGYWISTMLWYDNHTHKDFIKHWFGWIILMSINWLLYKTIDNLVQISMYFKYIEAVFMICTWGAVLNSKKLIKID